VSGSWEGVYLSRPRRKRNQRTRTNTKKPGARPHHQLVLLTQPCRYIYYIYKNGANGQLGGLGNRNSGCAVLSCCPALEAQDCKSPLLDAHAPIRLLAARTFVVIWICISPSSSSSTSTCSSRAYRKEKAGSAVFYLNPDLKLSTKAKSPPPRPPGLREQGGARLLAHRPQGQGLPAEHRNQSTEIRAQSAER